MAIDHDKLRAQLGDAQYELLMRTAKIQKAQQDFWWFCKVMYPEFYRDDRTYLKDFCYTLQRFLEGDDEILVVNMPPRHGKSFSAQNLVKWWLGIHPEAKIMTGSYNETLSRTFSRNVRDTIAERKVKGGRIVYSEIFPKTKIKRGDGAANLWALEGQHSTYLATSPGGTATGFGCSLMIMDDTIKNAEEAFNEEALEKQWTWWTQTMLSRREAGAKVIIIMTRWSTLDLAGRALEHFGRIGAKLVHVNYKALQDDGTMLCESVLSKRDFELAKEAMGAEIVAANYQQTPLDAQGRLYSGFKTYTKLPVDDNGNSLFEIICNYTDTADKGDDYLASITYGLYNGDCYVLDVYFTKDNMEITEPELAKRLYEHKVNKAWIESNNGGRGFARSVERILRDKYHWYKTYIDMFFQSKNKKARILGAATWVQQHVLFPEGWEFKWPDAYKDLMMYTKEGRAKHDDIQDCISGVYEKTGRGNVFDF